MDIQRVNEVLRKAIHQFEQKELDDLREYTIQEQGNGEDEGDFSDLSSAGEMYMSYVADLAGNLAGQFDISEDDALDAVLSVADDLAASGDLPELPDVDSSSDEAMATWTGAAKTADLARRAIEYVKELLNGESLDRSTVGK